MKQKQQTNHVEITNQATLYPMSIKNTKKVVSMRQRMASKSRARCAKCNKVRTYENPVEKCWECKQKFCYDDINSLQVNSKMKETDEVRNVCDKCKAEHGYNTLE